MRILFLHHFPLWGCGSGTFVRHLALELAKKRSYKVGIVCPEKKEIKEIKIFPVDLPFKVAFTGYPEWPNCRLYRKLSEVEIFEIFSVFLKKSLKAVKEFKPNILHIQHASLLTWVARFLQSFYKINFVVTIHGTGLYTAYQDKRYISLTRDGLRAAKKITAVSQDTKEKLIDLFGEDFRKKTRVIPGGVDLKHFPLKKEIKIINKKYSLEGKKIVLFSGKLTPYKGVKYLIMAAPKIKGEIFIIGEGEEKEKLKDLVKKYKIKNVHFLGYMGDEKFDELREFYYRADVFVAPSVWDEPLGLVILEAMACKTPVVTTRKGGIPLAVKDGLNGLFVRPRNSSQIAEKVNFLLKNDKLRKKMGEAARQIVEKKFIWSKIAEKFLRIYKRYAKSNHKI